MLKRRPIGAALAGLATLAIATLTLATPAAAAPAEPFPVASDCNQGWYVNPDEEALLPTQEAGGFLFDGPSLVHHAINPALLLSTLTPGTFTADVSAGVPPLFKVETLTPYSTLNYVGNGTTDLWWSSRRAYADPGGQGNPIAAAAFISLTTTHTPPQTYTAATTVFSFGVGYANDDHNTALVKTITFKGTTYDLACAPATPTPAAPAAAPALPVTGTSITGYVMAGAGLVLIGAFVVFLARRRRTT